MWGRPAKGDSDTSPASVDAATAKATEKTLIRYGRTLAVLTVVLVAFRLLCGWRAGMDFFSRYFTQPVHTALGWLMSFVPISVAEMLTVAFVLFCICYLVKAVFAICTARGSRVQVALQKGVGAVVIFVSLYTSFTLLWGVNYYTTSFEAKAGIQPQPISVVQLADTMQFFVNRVNETASAVPRDAGDVFAVPHAEVFENGRGLYTALEEEYPFLHASPRITAKPMVFSRAMSYINYTGIFFPFTGEANVNAEMPSCFLPSTIAHELAHVRGIGPEQTANFVAILACERSGKPEYVYSGYLLGYLHLSNALYGADRALWAQVNSTLCTPARADLTENALYWRQFDTAVSKAVDTVYNGFLKSYDQKLGLKSYGAVVDLLAVHYAPQAAGLTA